MTFEDRQEMWQALDFPLHSGSYPDTLNYVAALRSRYSNGEVLFHSFTIPSHPVFDRYLERNQLHECNFFERFWSAPTPAVHIPYQPASLNYFEKSLFESESPFLLGGGLSQLLFHGGAYSRSAGYGSEARRLGEAVAAELLAGDYEETIVARCQSAWSDFFMDVAWDFTAVVVSKPRRLIHTILATDTD